MAIMTFTVEDVHLVSGWTTTIYGSGSHTGVSYSSATTGTTTRTFTLSGLPAGSIINTAAISCTRRGSSGALRTMDGNHDSVNSTADITIATSRITPGGTLQIAFAFRATVGGMKAGYNTAGTYWENIVLTVDYTGYTACTAPTTVSINSSTATPSQTRTLSWSGAQAGLNNPITNYWIYRSTTADGTYTFLTETDQTSCTVTAPASAGSYYYRVTTVGTVQGYSSGKSSAYAYVTVDVTAPSVPGNVTLNPASPKPGGTSTLSWTATAGTNNPITGYEVQIWNEQTKTYQTYATPTASSCTVTVTEEYSFMYFRVRAIGTHMNSGYCPYVTLTVDYSGTSQFTLSSIDVLAGTEFTVTFSTNTDKAHTTTFSIGSYSQSVSSAANVGSITFTPPLNWLNAMPDSNTGILTVKVQTTGEGSITQTITLRCPDYAGPTNVTGTAAPYSTSVPTAWGIYAAGLSAATITISSAATAQYGATIAKYKIRGPKNFYAEGDTLPFSATSYTLASGYQVFTVTAVDSRGKQTDATINVYVMTYSKPTLRNILSLRSDSQGEEEDEGTYVMASAEIICSDLDNHNTATCAVAYRRQGTDTWTSAGSLSNGELLFGSGGISLPYNWDVRYTVTDTMNQTNVYYDVVTRAVWEMHVKKGGGAWAFGGVADQMGTLKVYGQIAAALGYVPSAVCDMGTDLDDATEPGLYWYLNTYTNRPSNNGGTLLVMKFNENYYHQLAFSNSSTGGLVIYARHHSPNGWGDWVTLTYNADYPYQTANVLNTTATLSAANDWVDSGLTANLKAGHLYAFYTTYSSGALKGFQLRRGSNTYSEFEYLCETGGRASYIMPVFYCGETDTYKIWIKRGGTGSNSYMIKDIGITQ